MSLLYLLLPPITVVAYKLYLELLHFVSIIYLNVYFYEACKFEQWSLYDPLK